MSTLILALICFFAGAIGGVLVAALCFAAGRADE